MDRRHFLSVSALSFPLSGCMGNDSGDVTETGSPESDATDPGTPRNTAAETATSPSEGTTPECWPSMCEGTALVEVVVAHGFSGDVRLRADCRADAVSARPGESVRIDREEDAETCGISVSSDGEPVFTDTIEEYERLTLTIRSNGDVDEEWIVT